MIDIAFFVAMRTFLGGNAANSVTHDLSNQFIGADRIGELLDAVVEVLQETGRFVFLRGFVVQSDDLIAAFNGTIRKPTVR